MNDPEAAAYFYNDVYHLLSEDGGKAVGESVLFYPSSFRRSSKYGREDSSNIVQRAAVLSRLSDASEEYSVVVTYPEAVAETVPKKSRIDSRTLKLATGEHLGMDFLREALHEYGFERHDFVYLPGQYSLRGGIIDVFSFSHNEPYRIEFFGDEIESIRVFDVNTQLSSDRKSSIRLIANIRRISEEVAESSAEISFLDYIPRSSVLWFDDPKATIASIRRLNDADRLPSAEDDAKPPNLVSEASFSEAIEGLTSVGFKSSNRDAESVFVFKTSPQPSFNKKFERLAGDISDFVSKGYLVSIVSENEKQIERLQNIFASVAKTSINFTSVDASVHEGFVDHSSLFCCYTDHQLFQRHHTYRIRGEVSRSNALTLQELNSLNNGDFIVHTDHGIGIFGGLVTTEVNGRMREMIRLTYRDNDVIFVGIQNLHRISKYRGSDGLAPTIHKPGSGVWNRLKQAAKRKIKDMAAELIKLYASRRATEGFAFSPDSYLQHELEASFVYDDTPDQLLATQAVKQDMERTYPMDRLVCGDVGFGKTEVAIRAAFKAATDGKQVAVLVPTTILALQHFKSFRSRLADFPITVDFVSRMRTSKENKRALDELQRGAVDVIIGTHRLLSKDVCFKDLGLLIIDEEQRFGVSSKEKLRQLRVNVDTLTLTATPIPRTLQFSVMGARDLSVINTPPPNRLPISTELHGFSEVIIAEAIDYETSRGGQVFFIHNRIKDIEDIERLIRRLCPKVRTVVAHGRMEGERLEEIMTDFVDGQYEVLIATTIIESGLDIPNANTIIINQAQNFGLSELHQLRGRVGRSNRKAFCYLLIPTYDAMTQEARRRLKAIEEFSDLGSGFNIAMQDLDIRGAGNLLGGEQSGFIAEIGFETYRRILDEAMLELREALPESEVRTKLPEHLADRYVTDCHVDTDVDACLPDDYITNKTEKLRLYRELDEIESDIELQQFRERLIDRFGPIPSQAEELFEGLRLRRAAIKLGFERIVMKNGLMFLYFTSNQQSSYYSGDTFARIIRYVQANPSKFKLKETLQRLSLTVRSVRTIGEALSVLNRWF
jgi:transcription-repair coupling factor (superfamily II helicase)